LGCGLFLAQSPLWLWPLVIAWWLYSFFLAMGIPICSPPTKNQNLGFFMRPLLNLIFPTFSVKII